MAKRKKQLERTANRKRAKRASVDEMIRREKAKLRRLEDLKKLKAIREKVKESRNEYLDL